MNPILTTGLLAALALGSPALAQGPVLVVDDDGGPGVDFTTLYDAMAAAPDGATLVLRPGWYLALLDNGGKSLTITGDGSGEPPKVYGTLNVWELPADGSFVIRGLRFENPPASGTSHATVNVGGCAGPVLIQGCTFDAHEATHIEVQLSDAVTIVDCEVQANAPKTFGSITAALKVDRGSASVYDSVFRGSNGVHGTTIPWLKIGDKGNPAATVLDGFVFASGSIFQGGNGGNGAAEWFGGACVDAMPGGPGIQFLGLDPGSALLFDTIVAGGAGGAAAGACAAGDPGPEVKGIGTASTLLGQKRRLAPLPLLAFGDTVTLELSGKPGDVAFLAASLHAGHVLLPELHGALALGLPLSIVPAGVVAADGTLSMPFAVPAAGPSVESLVGYLQPGFVNTNGAFFLGSPSVAIALAPAF